jgi:HlyD family secretion protein
MRRRDRFAAAASLAALLAACGGDRAPTPRYESATVVRGSLSVTVEASGTIEPVATVEVKSKASGEILELGAEIGDAVKGGQVLVRIDPRTAQNLVDQSQAELNAAIQREQTAKTQLERGEKLRENAWINQSELETLQLEVANTRAATVAAKVALENARIGLQDTEVRAPSPGTILTRPVEVGQVISSPTRDVGGGTLILTMADLTHVRARVRVDETDIGKLAPGVPARIQVAAYPGREFRGRVEKIEPQAVVDQNVTLFAVLIDVGNEDGLLRPGMNVDAVFDVAHRDGVLLLPVMALRAARDVDATAGILGLDPETIRKDIGAAPGAAGRWRGQGRPGADGSGALGLGRGLWVVAVRDGRDVPVPVQTGITDFDRVEITGGLSEGDQVRLLPTASLVEIQQQIQDIASRRGGIPGLTQKPATTATPAAQPAGSPGQPPRDR